MSFGAPEMAQMMEGVKGLIAFGTIASVLIGAALGLIIALFRDRDSGPQAWEYVGKHSGSAPARVNETAALAAVAAALEAPTPVNETAALAAVAAALAAPTRPTSAGGYLVAVPVIILAIIIGVAITAERTRSTPSSEAGQTGPQLHMQEVFPIKTEGPSEEAKREVLQRGYIAEYKVIALPPEEYDRPFAGKVIVRTIEGEGIAEALRALCRAPALACAHLAPDKSSCTVYVGSRDHIARHSGGHFTYETTLRHEIGHCNGWPRDHSGGRGATEKDKWPNGPA